MHKFAEVERNYIEILQYDEYKKRGFTKASQFQKSQFEHDLMKKIPDSVQKFYELNKINTDLEAFESEDETATSADELALRTPKGQPSANVAEVLEEESKEPLASPDQIEQQIAQQALEDAKKV